MKLNRKLIKLLILVFFFTFNIKSSLSKEQSKKSLLLKVMNYNVHGLPLPKIDHTRYRKIAIEIGKLRHFKKGPDILALQEAFHKKTGVISKIAGFKNSAKGPRGKGLKINSGLEVATDYEVLATNQMVYKGCTGHDCFSRKGVLHLRLKIPELPLPLDLYNTHLNSSQNGFNSFSVDGESEKIKVKQVLQLAQFISKTSYPGSPRMVIGDFNFYHKTVMYDVLTQKIPSNSAGEFCQFNPACHLVNNTPKLFETWIDHQFYSSNTLPKLDIQPVKYTHLFLDKNSKKPHLSDHPAVLVDYKISW